MYENGPKWGETQAGWPRPGRPAYPGNISSCNFEEHGFEHQIKFTPMWFRQNSQVKTERLEPSGVEPKSNDNPKIQNPTQLEEQCGP
jgi:hypothetical protein